MSIISVIFIMVDRGVNAGVHAKTGFALQRNMALHLLFTNFEDKFKSKKYFVCLEHHDDFLFCFLDNGGNVDKVETYQSKKSSSEAWSINEEFHGILKKVLSIGVNLKNDPIPKTESYSHELHFSSNASINLKSDAIRNPQTGRNETIATSVNESNCFIRFSELNERIREKIESKFDTEDTHIEELNNLRFLYIDFNRTVKAQKQTLLGELDSLFGNKITDRKAALDTLIDLFEKVENIFNQGHVPKLLDNTKRVTSEEINNAFRIITTESKAFDFWRSKSREISLKLNITLAERENGVFEFNFKSAFDLFKSPSKVEHQNILKFVREHYSHSKAILEEDLFEELYNKYIQERSTNLQEIEIKATIYAAYFEATNKRD